jgi:DNA segregation ATPase FtsK/SpoIIIE-like protein
MDGTWGTNADPLYEQAVALVRKHKRGSISLVQRHLAIGWNRAHGLIDAMVGTVLTDMPPIGKVIPAHASDGVPEGVGSTK